MSDYILSDCEITLICGNYITIERASDELRAVISTIPLNDVEVDRVIKQLVRMDLAIHNLKPLLAHLYELQGKEKKDADAKE